MTQQLAKMAEHAIQQQVVDIFVCVVYLWMAVKHTREHIVKSKFQHRILVLVILVCSVEPVSTLTSLLITRANVYKALQGKHTEASGVKQN